MPRHSIQNPAAALPRICRHTIDPRKLDIVEARMTFQESIRTCFIHRANFHGRGAAPSDAAVTS
jgi:hypothetical protein